MARISVTFPGAPVCSSLWAWQGLEGCLGLSQGPALWEKDHGASLDSYTGLTFLKPSPSLILPWGYIQTPPPSNPLHLLSFLPGEPSPNPFSLPARRTFFLTVTWSFGNCM